AQRHRHQSHNRRRRRGCDSGHAPAARCLFWRGGRVTRRLAIIGMGKMGHAIAELAPARGWEVVSRLDEEHTHSGITTSALNGADVAVEFTVPGAAPANIRATVNAGCPIVVGTTGWYNEMARITEDVRARNGA